MKRLGRTLSWLERSGFVRVVQRLIVLPRGKFGSGEVGSERKGQCQERERLQVCCSSSSCAALTGTCFPLADTGEVANELEKHVVGLGCLFFEHCKGRYLREETSRGLRLHRKCDGFPFIALPAQSVGSKHSHLKLLTKV